MSAPTSFKLNTGATIPAIGLGTWQAPPGEVRQAVTHALKSGYRHIDGALCYQNEEEVGQGIKDSGVPRSEIFVTTKLWCTYHDRVAEGLDTSLKSLGLDYVDLYLVHWPLRMNSKGNHPLFPKLEDGSRDVDFDFDQAKTWAAMEELLASGKTKAIGISNAGIPILKHLEKTWKVVPAVNQIENHPYNPEHELKEYCDSKGILIQAYSPLGSTGSPQAKEPALVKIAEKHGVSPQTVLISWHVNRGVVALPKSVTPARIESNLKTIKLDQEDIDALNKLAGEGGKQQRYTAPPFGSDFGFPNFFGPGNKDAPEGFTLLAGKA